MGVFCLGLSRISIRGEMETKKGGSRGVYAPRPVLSPIRRDRSVAKIPVLSRLMKSKLVAAATVHSRSPFAHRRDEATRRKRRRRTAFRTTASVGFPAVVK